MLKRRRSTVLLIVGFILICYVMYIRQFTSYSQDTVDPILLKRYETLKDQLAVSNKAIANIEYQIEILEKGGELLEDSKLNQQNVQAGTRIVISNRGDQAQQPYDLSHLSPSGPVCSLAEAPQAQTDVQMYDVIDSLDFADVDGGVWKQGFPIHYDDSLWSVDKPLKVFVIPHSHDDPGWIKTFDGYYSSQVQQILDNMVTKLGQHEKLKFIYAEISFFSKWWSKASTAQKDAVKKYIEEGRLELVTGGWVMPDEAVSHYWALLDQLVEGHTWIKENIGVTIKPRSGWSIDPFGHTSTMAYILKQSGLKNMLIQRVHYSVKKHFAQNKYLEFNWRQVWDSKGTTEILCHMMPFYSYDVPHTCGPDPKICCQFDFQRLPGGKIHCPWRKEPQAITDSNVNERAYTLLDQYRKKSTLYRSNVVLIPLGDDFRYDTPGEWDKQYSNYQKLFDYMNTQSGWHVQAQFGTLSDYFNEVRKESGQSDLTEFSAGLQTFPSLSGDFYTYADRQDHYWSGYFTSRPFYKHWDRHLESSLRSAEIIFSIARAKAHTNRVSAFPSQALYEKLTYARRSLGLFQHHDGITGTAKSAVVTDYGQRMLKGWTSAQDVIKKSAQLLMADKFDDTVAMFDIDWIKKSQDSLEVKRIHHIAKGEKKRFVLYNSSPHERVEMVRVWVSALPLAVYDSDSNPVICQVSPYFSDKTVISNDKFKLNFMARVPGLGMSTYTMDRSDVNSCTVSSVSYYNHPSSPSPDGVFDPTVRRDTKFTIHNEQIEVHVSTTTGMTQTIVDRKRSNQHDVSMNFIKYRSATGKDHASGAYLFIPNGGSQVISSDKPLIRVITGNLFHEVHSFTELVEHRITAVNTPGPESLGIEIVNIDSMLAHDNTELGMQLSSDVKNDDVIFYTDMNGFTMHKRKYQAKLKLQGNVYPMTSMAYIENDVSRLSVLAAQSAGVVSHIPGALQIILDRRLSQDDNRGLGEAVKDNKRTESKFFVILEDKTATESADKPISYPSMTANIIYQHLVSPLITLPLMLGNAEHNTYQSLTRDFPCELTLVNLRSSSRESTAEGVSSDSLLSVHHQAIDCNLPTRGLTCSSNQGKLQISDLFKQLTVKSFEKRTLTDLESLSEKHSASSEGTVQLQPMDLAAYKLTLQ